MWHVCIVSVPRCDYFSDIVGAAALFMTEHKLSGDWPAHIGAVAPIRHAVIAFARTAGATQARIDDIALAVTEAATNSVTHGLAATITVLGSVDDHALHLDVTDDGKGMAPDPASTGMGLGLVIIARLADEVRISGVATGGTRVEMRFGL